jgi:arylsulfatase A-like enzyme
MSSRPPDVFIVVLDAVRASDVYSDRDGSIRDLPFLSGFSRGAAVYPQASAVASWTLPSMATLVTGLYPWEHGVSAVGTSYLDPGVPTLASVLRGGGYATALLSANNVVGPRTNLSAGFERLYVADWWEQYLRLRRVKQRVEGARPQGGTGDPREMGRRPRLERVLRKGMRTAFRFPGVLERTSELAQRLRNPEFAPGVSVAPWIEPTFRDILTSVSRSTPLLVVVHLNDAHEPYFRRPRAQSESGQPSPPMVRQDYMRLIEGSWKPTGEDLAMLHELYREMVRALDHRIERLIGEFSAQREIDNALVLITSDHGQSFGEGGWLFHMNSPEEALLRVPMLVRFPSRGLVGRGRGWASTVDVVPTVLEATGLSMPRFENSYSLRALFEHARPTPAWALGDGLPLHHLEGIVSASLAVREGAAARRWLAAYEGPFKTVYDFASGTLTDRRVDVAGEAEAGFPASHSEEDRARIRSEAIRRAEELLRRAREHEVDGVSRRLESWGYGA